LLTATVVSLLIPFLQIPVYFSSKEADSSIIYKTLQAISVSEGENITVYAIKGSWTNYVTFQNFLSVFYLAISLLFLTKFIIAVNKIRRLLKRYDVEELEGIRFINTTEPGTPFSFFRLLFWNKKINLQSEKGQYIFRHELFHIQQKHSWDIVFTELLSVFLWINPFFFLIKKELKTIHEFLADQFATNDTSQWEYAELLLMQAFGTQHSLVNPFFHNQIKRRIAMITTSTTNSFATLRKVTGTLLTLLLFLLFSCQAKKEKDIFHPETIQKETQIKSAGDNKIFDLTETPASFKGGPTAWAAYLQKNLNPAVPVDNGAPEGSYTVYVQFIVDAEGGVSDIKTLTNHGYGMEEEAIRVITKGPTWTPAIQNGQNVKSYRKQPFTFVITAE
jgi:beta-lactamase regulating signal transducer with metallopeptidase domain